MNKERRAEIRDIHEKLTRVYEDLNQVRDDEQESFNNMPEGLQYSERGMEMEKTSVAWMRL